MVVRLVWWDRDTRQRLATTCYDTNQVLLPGTDVVYDPDGTSSCYAIGYDWSMGDFWGKGNMHMLVEAQHAIYWALSANSKAESQRLSDNTHSSDAETQTLVRKIYKQRVFELATDEEMEPAEAEDSLSVGVQPFEPKRGALPWEVVCDPLKHQQILAEISVQEADCFGKSKPSDRAPAKVCATEWSHGRVPRRGIQRYIAPHLCGELVAYQCHKFGMEELRWSLQSGAVLYARRQLVAAMLCWTHTSEPSAAEEECDEPVGGAAREVYGGSMIGFTRQIWNHMIQQALALQVAPIIEGKQS